MDVHVQLSTLSLSLCALTNLLLPHHLDNFPQI